MKKTISALMALSLIMTACQNDDVLEVFLPEIDGGQTETEDNETGISGYDEQFRPLMHYSPAKNWMNDPNGMVYINGVWHLFYQYNPLGADWGNMSWGHATSSDLLHWTEQPVALTRNELGDIFSGSCVIDKDNTAGFGNNAMIAIYTANGEHQQQALAYSTDNGASFTNFAGNPVIANSTRADFRDPKVFWYEKDKKWIMSLACGWEYKVEFWSSDNLKSWEYLSTFSYDNPACNHGQWECPDLIQIDNKWVLLVSVNPGAPNGGSGTQYFIGDFNGSEFLVDGGNYPKWMDYGTDNYAGVSWSNAPDNRHIMIGWMNNWNYAGASPVSPWRSSMTLPRELGLAQYDSQTILTSKVVKEIETIAGDWRTADTDLNITGPYHLQIEVSSSKISTFTLYNTFGQRLEMSVNPKANQFLTKRNAQTGNTSFATSFSLPSVKAALNSEAGETITLDLFVDQSSVEVFTSNGSMANTVLVYPSEIYNHVELPLDAKAKIRSISNIW